MHIISPGAFQGPPQNASSLANCHLLAQFSCSSVTLYTNLLHLPLNTSHSIISPTFYLQLQLHGTRSRPGEESQYTEKYTSTHPESTPIQEDCQSLFFNHCWTNNPAFEVPVGDDESCHWHIELLSLGASGSISELADENPTMIKCQSWLDRCSGLLICQEAPWCAGHKHGPADNKSGSWPEHRPSAWEHLESQ